MKSLNGKEGETNENFGRNQKKKRIRGIKRGAIRIEDDDAIRVCRRQIRVLRWEEETRGRMFFLFALSLCFGNTWKKKKTHEQTAASFSRFLSS